MIIDQHFVSIVDELFSIAVVLIQLNVHDFDIDHDNVGIVGELRLVHWHFDFS